jgi:hypothetical protein
MHTHKHTHIHMRTIIYTHHIQELARKQEASIGAPSSEEWDGRAIAVFDMSQFGWKNIDYASQVSRVGRNHIYTVYVRHFG